MSDVIIYGTLNPINQAQEPLYTGNENNPIYNIIGGPNVNFISAMSSQNLSAHLDLQFDTPFAEFSSFSNLKMSSYEDSIKMCKIDKDFAIAKHNLINDKFALELATKQLIDIECKLVAAVYVPVIRTVLTDVCAATVVPWQGIIACPLATFMYTNIGNKTAQVLVSGGCKYVVKNVSEKVTEITIEAVDKSVESYKEFKAWFSFINSVEGAFWLTGQLNNLYF